MTTTMREISLYESEQVGGGFVVLATLAFTGFYWAGAATTAATAGIAIYEAGNQWSGDGSGGGSTSDRDYSDIGSGIL